MPLDDSFEEGDSGLRRVDFDSGEFFDRHFVLNCSIEGVSFVKSLYDFWRDRIKEIVYSPASIQASNLSYRLVH